MMPQRLCCRPALNTSDIYSSTQVQDWLAPCGSVKSKPANVTDASVTVNSNSLRSQNGHRYGVYSVTRSKPSAGNHYSASTLVDNWAEARQASQQYQAAVTRTVKPVSLVPLLRSTEYQVSTSAPATARMQQLQHCYLGGAARPGTSPVPAARSVEGRGQVGSLARSYSSSLSGSAKCSSMTARSSGSCSPALHSRSTTATARIITSARNVYGSSSGLDSCAPGASIAATTLQHRKLEFQKPEPGDARAKLLAVENRYKARDAALAAKQRERLQERQGLASTWRSVYAQDYLQQPFVAAHENPKDVCPNIEQ